jgi:hypothetical protein
MRTLAHRRDQAEVVRRLSTVRPDSPSRWGRMSAHQMVCHLGDNFRMALGRKAVRPTGGPLQRTVVKWIALYAPLPWPRGIRTRPELDQELGGTEPGDFGTDRAEVESLAQAVSAQPRDFAWPPHPLFGRMSRADWLRWGYLHMDHHLRQFGV